MFFFFFNLNFVQIDKSDAMRSGVTPIVFFFIFFLSHLLLCVYVYCFFFVGWWVKAVAFLLVGGEAT